MQDLLQKTFIELTSRYSNETRTIETLWNEIEVCYSHKKRYYHTLTHLHNLLIGLSEIKTTIQDWDTLLFSLFYHDIVYNALKQDNEEQSAIIAAERMLSINVSAASIEKCKAQILATKTHQVSSDTDTNLFTDADLSILGQPPNLYKEYYGQVRKEYAIYPDLIYKPGRKKVLQHFLQMSSIFKTAFFRDKFEHQAKINLQEELNTL